MSNPDNYNEEWKNDSKWLSVHFSFLRYVQVVAIINAFCGICCIIGAFICDDNIKFILEVCTIFSMSLMVINLVILNKRSKRFWDIIEKRGW